LPTLYRRRFLAALFLTTFAPAALLVSGCPGPQSVNNAASPGAPSSPSTAPTDAASPGTPSVGKKIKAGLVTDVGGVNDKSFNQLAWEGMNRAKNELGAEIKYIESRQAADYVGNLSRFARDGYDVVFALGFMMEEAVKEVAPRFPNVKFALVDGKAPDLPNCVSYQFREEEGSFLVGALAGGVTKTNVVGFVGGMEGPLIKKFEVGYIAGVRATNPKAQVKVGYAGSFNDPQKGQEIALSQIGAKADILYQAAGNTGTGVIKAVADKGAGFYAIGVDKDQDGEAPGRVLTSMVKGVDVAVVNVCKSVADGTFKSGTVNLGLKENGVGMSEMKYTKKDVPPATLQKVEALKKAIIEGKIKPPATAAELASFQPPK
jgi:basic membrane protein A and related proteins